MIFLSSMKGYFIQVSKNKHWFVLSTKWSDYLCSCRFLIKSIPPLQTMKACKGPHICSHGTRRVTVDQVQEKPWAIHDIIPCYHSHWGLSHCPIRMLVVTCMSSTLLTPQHWRGFSQAWSTVEWIAFARSSFPWPRYSFHRVWVDPSTILDTKEWQKISLPLGIEPGPYSP